ncbi:MAG: hypothetical protein KDI27_13295 [Gammaproteobacteria bacterium]|nr:hypothetical protein [Gammaproteobacteria bacterium]
MAIRVGINGFGRMGRLGMRGGWGREYLNFVPVMHEKIGIVHGCMTTIHDIAVSCPAHRVSRNRPHPLTDRFVSLTGNKKSRPAPSNHKR